MNNRNDTPRAHKNAWTVGLLALALALGAGCFSGPPAAYDGGSGGVDAGGSGVDGGGGNVDAGPGNTDGGVTDAGGGGGGGGGVDGGTDGGTTPPPNCNETVAQYCGSGSVRCPSFNDVKSMCSSGIKATEDCGGYQVGIALETDVATIYYFDSSGNLVAIVQSVAGSHLTGCAVGPADFKQPLCPRAVTTPICG